MNFLLKQNWLMMISRHYKLAAVFFSSLFVNLFLVYFLNKLNIFQPQRADIDNKDVVVTFGGLSFIISILFYLSDYMGFICLLLSIGGLGLIDDYLKIYRKNSNGLRSKLKFKLECLFAFIYFYGVHYPEMNFFMFCLILWKVFVLISCANAVNLTDGVDALAASISLWCLLFLFLRTGDALAGAMMVSLIAFLLFNAMPAILYMGDVGALLLGSLIGGLYLKYNLEWWFPFIGIIFVLEVATSLIQIISIIYFKKKVFLMAPFHHHLLLLGYSRKQVLILFNVMSAIMFCCLSGYVRFC